jgi:hypothetical protein
MQALHSEQGKRGIGKFALNRKSVSYKKCFKINVPHKWKVLLDTGFFLFLTTNIQLKVYYFFTIFVV